MADTRTSLERLRDDLDPMRLRPGVEVRRRSEQQRRRRGLAVAVTAIAVVAVGGTVFPRGHNTGTPVAPDTGTPSSVTGSPPGPSPTATASDAVAPLLPAPWTLTHSRTTMLPANGKAGDDLCGVGASGVDWLPGPKPVDLQRFEDGDTSVQIWVFTEDGSATSITAGNLFKAFFAGCGGPGVVDSLGGPTNYWQVPGSRARMASLWIRTRVYVIRMTSQESNPPDVADLVAIIDERATP